MKRITSLILALGFSLTCASALACPGHAEAEAEETTLAQTDNQSTEQAKAGETCESGQKADDGTCPESKKAKKSKKALVN